MCSGPNIAEQRLEGGLREDKAWSLELRDVPGYDPGAPHSDRDAPTTFVQDASGG